MLSSESFFGPIQPDSSSPARPRRRSECDKCFRRIWWKWMVFEPGLRGRDGAATIWLVHSQHSLHREASAVGVSPRIHEPLGGIRALARLSLEPSNQEPRPHPCARAFGLRLEGGLERGFTRRKDQSYETNPPEHHLAGYGTVDRRRRRPGPRHGLHLPGPVAERRQPRQRALRDEFRPL